MFVLPSATPVYSPLADTVALPVSELAHFTTLVRSCVVLSANSPMAESCCVPPGKAIHELGEMVILTTDSPFSSSDQWVISDGNPPVMALVQTYCLPKNSTASPCT